ncbi:MAG: transposase, partial [Bryobacteraceae bacterium]
PLVEADAERFAAARGKMDQPAYTLAKEHREIVLASLLERCSQCEWKLLAAHVRTNHVHVVVAAEVRPERIMNDLKSYASRLLNKMGLEESARKRWARHGSTRWLWKQEHITAAVRYVVDEQGKPMAVFEAVLP